MDKKQENNRNKLKETKPLVYEKAIKGKVVPLIQLQYNYVCNFKCNHCSIDKVKNKNRTSLTPTAVKYIFDQADKLGMFRVTITGGEPLIFKDFSELVQAIGPDRFYISVDTNGWFFTKEVAQHLKDIGVNRIQPSLDSLDMKAHDEFRHAEGSAERVLRAVDIAQEVGLDVFIQTVVTKSRLYSQEFIDYIKYFNAKGVSVFVSFAKPVGAWEGHFEELVDKKDLDYLESLEKEYNIFTHLTPGYGCNGERNCISGSNIFSITQYGDCLPCPYFYSSMGNLFEESLEDILKRIQSLKPFKKDTCLIAEDREFIDKYLVKKIYGKELPVPWQFVFEDEDFEKGVI